MSPNQARRGVNENEVESVEDLLRAEPDVFVGSPVDRWAQAGGQLTSHHGVGTVGADYQVGVGHRGQVGHFHRESKLRAEFLGATTEKGE
jgi:hypothetical protein